MRDDVENFIEAMSRRENLEARRMGVTGYDTVSN
jgi:hypothetical protein